MPMRPKEMPLGREGGAEDQIENLERDWTAKERGAAVFDLGLR